MLQVVSLRQLVIYMRQALVICSISKSVAIQDALQKANRHTHSLKYSDLMPTSARPSSSPIACLIPCSALSLASLLRPRAANVCHYHLWNRFVKTIRTLLYTYTHTFPSVISCALRGVRIVCVFIPSLSRLHQLSTL